MNRIAIFDLDNTLVRGSALFYALPDLWRSKAIGTLDVIKFTKSQFQFRNSRSEDASVAQEAMTLALSIVAGKRPIEVEALLEPTAKRIVEKHLIPETLAEMKALKLSGHEIWIASASPIEIVKLIGDALGVSEVIATRPQIRNGLYTGQLEGKRSHGFEKFAQVQARLIELGRDWESVIAFSDSINDLPLLAAAESSVVVNPNRQFEMLAKKNGWRVIHQNPVPDFGHRHIPNIELPPTVRLKAAPGRDFVV